MLCKYELVLGGLCLEEDHNLLVENSLWKGFFIKLGAEKGA
jgi:hypothetical protein